MTRETVIQCYLTNSPKVVAEMLYDTIEKYEAKLILKDAEISGLIKVIDDLKGKEDDKKYHDAFKW